jgi:glutamine amidotransferase
MCRVLAYLGKPTLLDELLYQPDSSLVRQAYAPQMLELLNLAGFGLAAWDPNSHAPEEPFVYRSTTIPIFDANLRAFARKVRAGSVVAHVRGVAYNERVQIGEHNLHPFRFEGSPLVLAHNGDLHRFAELRAPLIQRMDPAVAAQVRGTTDSEHMYALLLSQLPDRRRRRPEGVNTRDRGRSRVRGAENTPFRAPATG